MQTKQKIVTLLQNKELPHCHKAKSCNKSPKFTKSINKEQRKPSKELLHCHKAKSYHKTFKRKTMEETLNPSKTLKLKKIL
jgi:hypothetical protein